jgi:hypothetical protein
MTIAFERTGGLMGHPVSLNLDLDEIPADQSATLKRFVDESDFFELSDAPKKTSRLDEFSYTITITTGTLQHTIRISDSSAPESLRPLLKELSTYAKGSR